MIIETSKSYHFTREEVEAMIRSIHSIGPGEVTAYVTNSSSSEQFVTLRVTYMEEQNIL